MTRLNRTAIRHYQDLTDRYVLETGRTQYELNDVVDWGLKRGDLEVSPEEVRRYHLARLSEALRKDTGTDRSGRTIRLRHCVVRTEKDSEGHSQQRTFWAHVDEAPDEFLVESLFQRRDRVKEDIEALKVDLEYINEKRVEKGLRSIQMSLEFRRRSP